MENKREREKRKIKREKYEQVGEKMDREKDKK